jgi:type II secretory pathway component PulJ
MNMHKGFSLIELIVIIAVLPFILITIDKLFASMFTDVPKSLNTIQDNSVLLNMLNQMEQDIDAANDLPQSIDGYTAGDELLLIKQADSVIQYQRKGDYIYRYEFKDGKQVPEQTRYWLLPETKITWQVHRKDGKGYAVEIRHHNEYVLHGHLVKKMENSNLFYIGILE